MVWWHESVISRICFQGVVYIMTAYRCSVCCAVDKRQCDGSRRSLARGLGPTGQCIPRFFVPSPQLYPVWVQYLNSWYVLSTRHFFFFSFFLVPFYINFIFTTTLGWRGVSETWVLNEDTFRRWGTFAVSLKARGAAMRIGGFQLTAVLAYLRG